MLYSALPLPISLPLSCVDFNLAHSIIFFPFPFHALTPRRSTKYLSAFHFGSVHAPPVKLKEAILNLEVMNKKAVTPRCDSGAYFGF
ncbi:hypothetical protein CsSME_00007743 [Camellia sinensis var. sinensis]